MRTVEIQCTIVCYYKKGKGWVIECNCDFNLPQEVLSQAVCNKRVLRKILNNHEGKIAIVILKNGRMIVADKNVENIGSPNGAETIYYITYSVRRGV